MVDRADDAVPPLVDRLFREEAGRLIALLTRLLGPAHLALAEDVVQEAFIAALGTWPRQGVPSSPAAWLLQVARRRALDALRRDSALAERAPSIAAALDAELESAADAAGDAAFRPPDDAPFDDDRLRMILLCCHPAVSADTRVALTLKVVSGFGVGEIARAFVADERAVAQRLVRAKRALREAGATFEMPSGEALQARMDAVCEVLYLMFNEGHLAHTGDALVRHELAFEALRLAERLARGGDPSTVAPAWRTHAPIAHALAALFCFQASRFDARLDSDGAPIRLAEQDRERWDATLIARGYRHLERAASGDRLTSYHVEAEIASIHASAPSWLLTDWDRIVRAYDRLVLITDSPVVRLNRVVAVRERDGAAAAWFELQALLRARTLDRYPLLHAVRGALLTELGRPDEAREAWALSRALTASAPMQRQVDQRLGELVALSDGGDVDSVAPRPS